MNGRFRKVIRAEKYVECHVKVVFVCSCLINILHNEFEIGVARELDTSVFCKSSRLEFCNIVQRLILERLLVGICLFRCTCLLRRSCQES
jgi:hypothetical protein